MNVRVTVRGLSDQPGFHDFALEKLTSTLQRFEPRIQHADLVLEHQAGAPRHGLDKHCRIDVRLRPSSDVVIHQDGDDPFTTLAQGLDRLKAAISRRTGQHKRGIGGG